jgi:lysophospholipase L1-like esterase
VTSRTLRGRLGRGALALLLGLATLEITLRLVAANGYGRFASLLREWDPDSTLELRGEHCFRPWPGSTLRFPNGTASHVNALGFRGPAVEIPKPKHTYRVVVLGGSTAHGFLVDDDQTIDAHLRRMLRIPHASSVEVVNLGGDGLDALCEQERLAGEGLALEPDAVVLHTGINDVPALRFADLPPDAPERGLRAVTRTSEEVRRSDRSLWRVVKHFWVAARLPGVLRKLGDRDAPVPGPPSPDPRALAALERTVRATIALVPSQVPVLLSPPPWLLDDPDVPAACARVVDAATTQRYRESVAERLRRVADDERAAGRDVRYVPHRLPRDVFLDDCHLDGDGNRLVAADLARALTSDDARRAP